MKLSCIVSIACLAVFIGCSRVEAPGTKTSLSAVEFSEKIAHTPECLIIDVRTPREFDNGHLHNARNFNWSNPEAFDYQISELDTARPVFIYCQTGGRSSGAARILRTIGFRNVYELDGGIMSWRSESLPEARTADFGGMTRDDFTKLLNSDKPVLVDFNTEWCAPCKVMEPILKDAAKSDKFTLVRINTDDHPTIAKELKIDAVPTLQFYRACQLVWTHKGFISKEDLLIKLQ